VKPGRKRAWPVGVAFSDVASKSLSNLKGIELKRNGAKGIDGSAGVQIGEWMTSAFLLLGVMDTLERRIKRGRT